MTTNDNNDLRARLWLDFQKADTIRGRIEIKRKTFAAGERDLVDLMLTALVPESSNRHGVQPSMA